MVSKAGRGRCLGQRVGQHQRTVNPVGRRDDLPFVVHDEPSVRRMTERAEQGGSSMSLAPYLGQTRSMR